MKGAIGFRQLALLQDVSAMENEGEVLLAEGRVDLFGSLERRGLIKPASGECSGDCGQPYPWCYEGPCSRPGYALTDAGRVALSNARNGGQNE